MGSSRLNLSNYMGGKWYMINEIVSRLDYSKRCYVELFGGSAKVLLNKPRHKVEIYNDSYFEIYNLFRVVRESGEEFERRLKLYPVMEQILYDFRDNVIKIRDDIDRAVKAYYLYNLSFSGNLSSLSCSFRHSVAGAYYKKLDKLCVIAERLKGVMVLNRDYSRVLKSLSRKEDIMLYADPPYYQTEYYYLNEFNRDDHIKLAEQLNNAKYSVMVSYYEFEGIEDLYPPGKWTYLRFPKPKSAKGLTVNYYDSQLKKNGLNDDLQVMVKPYEDELLILNYAPATNGNILLSDYES